MVLVPSHVQSVQTKGHISKTVNLGQSNEKYLKITNLFFI